MGTWVARRDAAALLAAILASPTLGARLHEAPPLPPPPSGPSASKRRRTDAPQGRPTEPSLHGFLRDRRADLAPAVQVRVAFA